ncbi:copper amine oxidase N-terminal domain-containing protein [Paenibacillus sp. FA6]|uniref:copper amine oxidase N-terminal domain-containing protein n=1 Tax=Paenibacillus sp. FA6 TaxID=3413029 RepID=UPI003F6585F9
MKKIIKLRKSLGKIGVIGLLLLVSAGSGVGVIHADTNDQPFQITIDGATMQSEVIPFQRNGTIMVPIRVVTEALGSTVSWLPAERKVNVSNAEHKVHLTVGSKQAFVNDKEAILKEAAEIREGRVFIPLRFSIESFGARIKWDAATRTAAIESTLSSAQAKSVIADTAEKAIQALKNKDLITLSNMSSLNKGIRFSPYGHVNLKEDRVLTHEGIAEGFDDNKKYIWGLEDGTGTPISRTFDSYYKRFVYSGDFAKAPQISYNQTLGTGNTLNNVRVIYPNAIVVEYYYDGFDPQYEGMDWQSLRLVFESEADTWVLVGIIHDEWTI